MSSRCIPLLLMRLAQHSTLLSGLLWQPTPPSSSSICPVGRCVQNAIDRRKIFRSCFWCLKCRLSQIRSGLSCCTQRVPGSEASLAPFNQRSFAPAAACAQGDRSLIAFMIACSISRLEDSMNNVVEVNVQKPASPLSVRNFRLLWIGEGISLLGDQFYMIALPWLVLQLTGSALALGTVMALAGIPRALFVLVGGAFVDRFSPRSVMIASNLARLVLVVLLSALVLTNTIRIEMLYAFALAFGLADSFYFPGQSAIIPQLLPEDQLQAGNTFVQGTAQLSLFLGPVLAGALIALLGHAATADSASSTEGIGIAFGIDALSFVASLLCLN